MYNVWQLFFRGTASRNRLVWGGTGTCTMRWPRCCWYSGSCKHPGTGRWPLRKAGVVQASEMTVLAHICRPTGPLGLAGMRLPFFDLKFPRRAAPQRQPACTSTAIYVAHFFQANFELQTYDVEKWEVSRWNHRQLKIGRRLLDLWQRLYIWKRCM
jgi:hypothetical protein